jgi:hypothetical protein
MRLNPDGVSINTLLYVAGYTTFNNAITFTSSLNVSDFRTLNQVICLLSQNVNGISTKNIVLTCPSLTVPGNSNIGP